MGRDFEDFLRSAEKGGSDLWHKIRAQAAAGTQDAYQRGRQVYSDTIRTGRDVVARTASEARLGRAANAAVRGFANAASVGAADPLEAGTEALAGLGGAGDFQKRYQSRLALQHQADTDAKREFPDLNKWSSRSGALGGMVGAAEVRLPGFIAEALPAVGRAVRAVNGTRRIGFVPRGLATMGVAGGATAGATGQVINDAAHGDVSSPLDVIDSAAGGALGGYEAVRGHPVFAAAAGAGMTAGLQEMNRGIWSPDDILQSAQAGAYTGQALNALGRFGSNALPPKRRRCSARV